MGDYRVDIRVIWGIIGYILGLYRGYIGIMEKKMETTLYSTSENDSFSRDLLSSSPGG